MSKIPSIDAWMKASKHLPPVLRDWHFQKDLFKTIDERVEKPTPPITSPNWVDAHVYVIDTFLWYMAKRGYTLQRVRQGGDFRDLGDDVNEATAARQAQVVQLLKGEVG